MCVRIQIGESPLSGKSKKQKYFQEREKEGDDKVRKSFLIFYKKKNETFWARFYRPLKLNFSLCHWSFSILVLYFSLSLSLSLVFVHIKVEFGTLLELLVEWLTLIANYSPTNILQAKENVYVQFVHLNILVLKMFSSCSVCCLYLSNIIHHNRHLEMHVRTMAWALP